jgi:hypothetical protein
MHLGSKCKRFHNSPTLSVYISKRENYIEKVLLFMIFVFLNDTKYISHEDCHYYPKTTSQVYKACKKV